MRKCVKCDMLKHTNEFDGNRKKCRECRNKEAKNRVLMTYDDRVCIKCLEFKISDMFEGSRKKCKECRSNEKILSSRTKEGHIKKIYNNQKENSKKRGHNLPTYSLNELRDWLMSQDEFHLLYDNWKRLDYQKWYAPSVDRKDDKIGYTISNIQLMTWKMNCDKSHNDSKTHKLQTGRKKVGVDMYSLDGKYLQSFISIREAGRFIGKNVHSDIIKCCNGKRNKCSGYKWKYSTDGGGAA